MVANWEMTRNYIEGSGQTRARLAGIKATAVEMRECLLAGDFDRFADVLNAVNRGVPFVPWSGRIRHRSPPPEG